MDNFETFKEALTAIVASSVTVSIGDVTLSVTPPEHVHQSAIIMAKVKTGKENHNQVLEKMSGSLYAADLHRRMKMSEVLKDIVITTPIAGEPIVIVIPRKFVRP